jgi:hypothetical protein
MQDIEANEVGALAGVVGPRMLYRFPFSLKMVAAIIGDKREPVSLRTVRSWTTGELLTIKPTLRVEGQRRLAYGFQDLVKFLLAKRLLRGPSPLPSVGVQVFLDHWQKPEFLKGISFHSRMKGTFVLYVSPDDADHLGIDFLAEGNPGLPAAMNAAVEKSPDGRICVLSMDGILTELLRRLFYWLEGTPFPDPKLTTKAEWLETFKIAGDVKRRVDEIELVK